MTSFFALLCIFAVCCLCVSMACFWGFDKTANE